MNTRMWGPPTWRFLEGVVDRYPEEMDPPFATQVAYNLFFRALARSLPCVYCRQSYFCFLRKRPLSPALRGGRAALRDWLYTVHNDVNKKLEKPVLPLEEARRVGREVLSPGDDLDAFRRSASVILLANAYNYPEEPPADSKTEDFYRLWTDALPALNDRMPDHPLGAGLRAALARHPLTEEILEHRSTVVDWVLVVWQEATGARLPDRMQLDEVFDRTMRAGKKQCLDAARGTPAGPGAGAGGACV